MVAFSGSTRRFPTGFFNGTPVTILDRGNLQVDSGSIYVGSSANANMTTGLTLNQGAADNEIVALKSSDVTHGITGVAETNTYGLLQKFSGANGGLTIGGLADTGNTGALLFGIAPTDNTTKTTAGRGYTIIRAQKTNGTTIQDAGVDANLLTIDNNQTTRYIFDAEGSAHADVEWTTYDTYDDLAVIENMESELLATEDESQTARRKMLESAGIIGEGSWHSENGKPRAVVNMTKLAMLHHGALIQANQRIKALEAQLALKEG